MNSTQSTRPIAVQLYTLRHLPGTFDQMLAAVADAGYSAVELVGDHGQTADEMRELLAKHDLTVTSSHVPLEQLQADFDDTIAFHHGIGNDTLVVPYLDERLRGESADQWRDVGRTLDQIGRRCRDRGVRLLYHNHAFEMAEVEGRPALDWLLADTDPDHLDLELDLAWVVRGGQDPLALLERYAGRCVLVHAKDVAPVGQNEDQGGWADVGYGTLDWETLIPAAHRAGAQWFIVEHDEPRDPVRTIRRSWEFLQQLV